MIFLFLALSGAQGVTISVCLSVCPRSTSLFKALNLHLSLIGLSQISLSYLTYFVVQTDPKILRLVSC